MGNPEELRITKILVIGNQHISRSILGALIALHTYKITLLTYPHQEPYLPPGVNPSSVTHLTSDLQEQSLRKTLKDQDLVISTMSPGDLTLQKRIVDACLAAGIKKFIPNEFGFDSGNPEIQRRLPAYEARGELIQYLKTKQEEKQLEWVGLAVGTIFDHELISGKIGFDLKWHSASIPGRGSTHFPATSLKRVGDLVAAVILRWSSVKNTYLYASGCIASADQVVLCLQMETKANWVVDFSDSKNAVREAEQRLEKGWPDAGWTLMERSIVFDFDIEGVQNFMASSANAKLGFGAEKIDEIVHSAVHEWNHSDKGDCGCS